MGVRARRGKKCNKRPRLDPGVLDRLLFYFILNTAVRALIAAACTDTINSNHASSSSSSRLLEAADTGVLLCFIVLYYTSGRRPDLFETHQSILKAVALV